MFESLSDRLTGALSGLRGKGRLTDADIDATAREIRLALLEADVSLPVVRNFIGRIKERAKGTEWYEERFIPRIGPVALYGLLFAMPLVGWWATSAYGAPISVFGLFELPPLVAKPAGR